LTKEVAVLEFKMMFKSIMSDISGKFDEYLLTQGIMLNPAELDLKKFVKKKEMKLVKVEFEL
jgi:hypothetical protein